MSGSSDGAADSSSGGGSGSSSSGGDGSSSSDEGGSSSDGGGSSSSGAGGADSSSGSSGMLDGCVPELDPDAPIDVVPERVAVDGEDVLYLFDDATDRVLRWSAECGSAFEEIQLGAGASDIALVTSHEALYVLYTNGDITAIDLGAAPVESPFTTLLGNPAGIAAAGNFLVAVDDEGAWHSHYTFDATGTRAAAEDWNYASPEYVWNEANGRLYFFRGGSPADIHWEAINQATGAFTEEGESPYHGAYSISAPLRVSDDGSSVVIGSGHVYDGVTLERPDAIPREPIDAAWVGGELVTLSPLSAAVERWDPSANHERTDAAPFPGAPVAFAPTSTELLVLTWDPGALHIEPYAADGDGDGDGVAYDDDAFPLDPAASEDTDHDGAPDAWNPGMDAMDSTTGLVLDAFPMLAACTSGASCDLDAQTLSAQPTSAFVDDDGVIHMLAPADERIVRWASETSEWLDPIPVAPGAELMTWIAATDTLVVAHDDHWIGAVDLGGDLDQVHWRTLPAAAHGLAMAGQYVLAADDTGAWDTHYTFAADGTETGREDWNQQSSAYGWSDLHERIYFFRDGSSPNDLEYEQVAQFSGAIVDAGDSPYHGDYAIAPPIVVSDAGDEVMIGTGQIYDAGALTHVAFLPGGDIVAGHWAADHILVLRDDIGGTLAQRYALDHQLESSQLIAGEPYRVFPTAAGEIVVTLVGNEPQMSTY